ncbi:MAG: hypothetical protein D6761_09870 [Candidatus Dadabacteria bacterium]|nr:MAG: hypothetical protein D6761_09870 [Candidatus Dadabacteria bacterium]
MNYDAAKFWFEVVVFLFNVSLWIYVWRSNKDKATNEKIEALERKHNDELKRLTDSLSEMDKRLVLAIGKSELEPIYDRLRGIGESFSEMAGEFKGVKRQLELIQEALINGGKA